MHYILITQRVEIIKEYEERRDCLDQQWSELIYTCGAIPIIIPNHTEIVKELIQNLKFDGIILTGGNNLSKYNGDSPERDQTETYLLDYAINNNIPLLGVCRGMQLIQDYFGIKLKQIEGHVGTKHKLEYNKKEIDVNSYHNLGTKDTTSDIEVLSRSSDNIIEAIKHKHHEIYGMMHHPERVKPFSQWDVELIKNIMKI